MAKLRRRVRIELTPELLLETIKDTFILPGDSRITWAGFDGKADTVFFYIDSQDFREVPEGGEPPCVALASR